MYHPAAWHHASIMIAVAATIWMLHRSWLRYARRQLDLRMRERMDERIRIARELHDTLLQSVQGLILQVQCAASRMPADEPSRRQLEAALRQANDVVAEGRDRVLGLRIPCAHGDLLASVQDLAGSTAFQPGIPIRIGVVGEARPVHPLVLSETRKIAGEALLNIARHARAKSIEVAITYGPQGLAIRIQDDGVGLPDEVRVAGSKPGHFGLVGMRERTDQIGGTLCIESRPGAGTNVTLALPARLAFIEG